MKTARFARTIARYTLLEALRNRLAWLALAVIGAALGVAAFLHQVTITESREVGAAVVAAMLRLAAAFLVVAFVVTSMVREFNDKVLEIVLARPVPRASYLLGKFVGFSTAALVLAVAFAAPLALFAPAARVMPWAFSLGLELVLMVAVGLFCVLTLTSVVAALAAAAGFYLLARSISAALVIAAAGEGSARWTDRVADWTVSGIARLVPALDQWTQTAWLVVAPPDWANLAGIAAQAGVYVLLIVAAALFDFYRQNF
ncbi:MAG: ABC transporter permease [Burkholderiales bacterium]|nr:ABC transporter permease [Burkholderiales bacterium]